MTLMQPTLNRWHPIYYMVRMRMEKILLKEAKPQMMACAAIILFSAHLNVSYLLMNLWKIPSLIMNS